LFEELYLGTYRSRLAIIADILQAVSQTAKKTHILFQTNLSYKVLQKYLAEVIRASLINFENKKKCYTLTEKGNRFLDIYQKYLRDNKRVEAKLSEALKKKNYLEKLCSNI
jgi:predicted transcriptional regulator